MIKFYKSSIGKKWVVALTGLVLIAYVLGHLAGNLQIFISPEQINRYAHFLHSLGPALWVVRAFLLLALVLHVETTIRLVLENRAARPEEYAVGSGVQARLSTRTMIVSGLVVLCFVVFHILHFTTRADVPVLAAPGGARSCCGAEVQTLDAIWQKTDANDNHQVYNMLVAGFLNPYASGFYILGLILLCSHLSHAFSSVLQTLGINNRRWGKPLVAAGQFLAWAVCAGYLSIPLAVLAGFLKMVP